MDDVGAAAGLDRRGDARLQVVAVDGLHRDLEPERLFGFGQELAAQQRVGYRHEIAEPQPMQRGGLSESGCSAGTFARAAIEPRRRHVAVAHGLDLLDAVLLGERVEYTHQVVEISDDLFGRKFVGRRREADDPRIPRSRTRCGAHDPRFARLQPRRDRIGHHGCDQRLGALVLLLQFQLGVLLTSVSA